MKHKGARLYRFVLLFIALGIFAGAVFPEHAIRLKPLGDAFIALIKMVIAPLIFCTVALGIGGTKELKKVGRVGLRALVYFEVVSTFALVLGLIIANTFKPGARFHVDPASLNTASIQDYASRAQSFTWEEFFLHLIPKTFFEPLTGGGDLLQVFLAACLFGFALHSLSAEKRSSVTSALDTLVQIFFKLIAMLMWLAPIGAGAAMAFTVGKYGIGSIKNLAYLMGSFYATCILFIFVVLGSIARFGGFSILSFLRYILDEILIVLGTSSSESVLVPLMKKLENAGCSPTVVGLVIPTGYSFNLDGTNIYLTLACLFIAQALGIDLSLGRQLSILLIAMLTSKGASGVTGAGFITLAATLSIVPEVPVAGMALILGVDRFMSEARAITNMIGNAVATVMISKWEGELDSEQLKRALSPSKA